MLTHYRFKPSLQLTALYLGLYLVGGYCLYLSGVSWALKLIAAGLMLFSAVRVITRYTLYAHPQSIAVLRYQNNGWEMQLQCGENVLIELEDRSCLWPCLLVLNWRTVEGARRYTCLVGSDSLSTCQFRSLYSFLLLQQQKA